MALGGDEENSANKNYEMTFIEKSFKSNGLSVK
jgi:hypothetical protein